MPEYLYNNLTSTILACYYQVFHSPTSKGLTEDNLKRALMIEFRKHNLHFQQKVFFSHRYENQNIGTGFLDLVIENKVVAEIRRVSNLRPMDKDRMRALLLDGGYAVGLILNFGSSNPQIQRVYESSHDPSPIK